MRQYVGLDAEDFYEWPKGKPVPEGFPSKKRYYIKALHETGRLSVECRSLSQIEQSITQLERELKLLRTAARRRFKV